MSDPSPDDPLVSSFTRRQIAIIGGFLVLIIGISFALGYFTRQLAVERIGNYALLDESYKILKDHAYKALPDQIKLEYGMIHGMLQTIGDPYTTFIEPPEAELQTNQLEGKFGGIGIRIEKDIETHTLIYPLPGSSAVQSGVLEGDRLIAIERLIIQSDTDMNDIQSAIRGPIGSNVKITVIHPSQSSQVDLVIKRIEVVVPSVTSNIDSTDPAVGIIHLSIIADTSPAELTKAIKDLQSRGAARFILDLRNNGGGLVEAGVSLVKLFLPKNKDIIAEQFRGEKVRFFRSSDDGPYINLPISVLVNQDTASAAEIMAGALQYNQRAQLIGNKTFGKDAVQLVFSLSDGSSLHITSGLWWVPGQEGILGGKGLRPDQILSDQDANSAVAIQTAKKIFQPQ